MRPFVFYLHVITMSLINTCNLICFSGFLGSVGFVAPEVVKKEEHTTGMDVFSVGIIMYMMFNYKRPRITDE